MRKIIIGLFLGLCLCGALRADTTVERIGDLDTQTILDPGGYKWAKWGMSLEEVKQTFKKQNKNLKYDKKEEKWAYKDKIGGETVTIYLMFLKNKFYNVLIFFRRGSNDVKECISKWEELSEILVEKYGEPSIKKPKAGDKGYLTDGQAIETNEGQLFLEWEIGETSISLSGLSYLCKEGDWKNEAIFKLERADIILFYTNKKIQDETNQERKENIKEQL